MTVSSIPPYKVHCGNNSSKQFDFDFLIEDESQLVVKHMNKEEETNLLVNNLDYSIKEINNENGSSIIFPLKTSKYKVLGNDEKIILSLTLPIKQECVFNNSDGNIWKNVEKSFDYLTRVIQILDREVERTVKIDEGKNQTCDELLASIEKSYIESKNYCKNAQEAALNALNDAAKAKNISDELQDKISMIKPAGKDTLGMIKPDNKTTFTDEDGTLRSPKWNLFDIVQKDHKLTYEEKEGLELLGEYVYKDTQDKRYGYPDFYAKCLEEYNSEDNTEEIEGITIKINSNGHKFYDIKDKEKIDEIYETTGVAWYYGIDEENQRILLPRISNIILTTKEKIPVIGNGMTFGVTDGQKYFGLLPSGNHYEDYIGKAYGAPVGSTQQDAVFSSGKSLGVTSDPEKSGIIADLSLVKNKEIYHVYMVVGNTTITQAQTEVTEVAASENDTIPLFYGQYFDFTPNHVSWLKAGANESGKIYQSAYNELLKISKGEETKYGEGFKVIKETAKLPDTDYSEYWIVNEEEQTFRTPLKTSLLNTISNARILIDKKEPTEEDKSWYNLYSDGWLEQGNWGQPLNSATGRNLVKLLKPYKDTNYEVFASSTAGHAYASASVSSESEIGCETRGHDFSLQQCSVSWITKGYAQKPNVEEISKSQNTGLYFKVANAVENQQLIDCGEVLEELNNKIGKTECKSYVIDTYINEDSGYRVYSDGYCEQWGRLTTKSSGDEKMTVTLLKTYSNTDYKVLTQILDTTDTPFIPWYLASVTNKTVNSFQKYTHPHWPLDWYACGYLAEGEY